MKSISVTDSPQFPQFPPNLAVFLLKAEHFVLQTAAHDSNIWVTSHKEFPCIHDCMLKNDCIAPAFKGYINPEQR